MATRQKFLKVVLTTTVIAMSIALLAVRSEAKEPKPEKPIKYSGFLDPYPDLQKGKRFDLVWFKEGADFSKYNKLMVEPVVFFLSDQAKYKGIHADELKKISDSFSKAFSDALNEAYPLVDKPGPDVLHVRAALTEIVPNKPAVSAACAIIPGGSLAFVVLPEKYNNIGSATIEVEFLDSESGERIAAGIDRRAGKMTEVVSGMSTWGHVEKAFKEWAANLKLFLDEKHGKETQEEPAKKEQKEEKKP